MGSAIQLLGSPAVEARSPPDFAAFLEEHLSIPPILFILPGAWSGRDVQKIFPGPTPDIASIPSRKKRTYCRSAYRGIAIVFHLRRRLQPLPGRRW